MDNTKLGSRQEIVSAIFVYDIPCWVHWQFFTGKINYWFGFDSFAILKLLRREEMEDFQAVVDWTSE